MLVKGPTFCPTTSGTFLESKSEIADFTRKLKLREKYWETNFTNDCIVKEKNTKHVWCKNSELNNIVENIENMSPMPTKLDSNISKNESEAFKQLKSHTDIVIKKADKGSIFVVLDTEFYRDKLVLHDHLNTDTYEIVPSSTDNKVMKNLNLLINKHKKCLYEQEITYINNKNGNQAAYMSHQRYTKAKLLLKCAKQPVPNTYTCQYLLILKGAQLSQAQLLQHND